MAAMRGNPARTNSRAIFTSMTPIASWSWPNAGITCGSGLPIQLGTVRFLGTFLDDVVGAPAGVIADLARQLGIGNPDCIAVYREGRARWQHAREIRVRLGYREFTDPFMRFRLARWLYALCWTGTDRPSVLFDRATAWLVSEKVLLPGASALERLVARIRDRAARRLWRSLSRDITRAQREQLDGLLLAGDGGGQVRSIVSAMGLICEAVRSWRVRSSGSMKSAC